MSKSKKRGTDSIINKYIMPILLLCTAGIIAIVVFVKEASNFNASDIPISSTEITSDFSSALIKSEVIRVKDGDTYVLKINGVETTVRLIGVDTPESVAPPDYSKENTSEGRSISEIVKQKIQEGDIIYIEYDVSLTDKYGRTLAYLYFEDGTMVQEWLIENGYAQIMTIQPNTKYADRFIEIQRKTIEKKAEGKISAFLMQLDGSLPESCSNGESRNAYSVTALFSARA